MKLRVGTSQDGGVRWRGKWSLSECPRKRYRLASERIKGRGQPALRTEEAHAIGAHCIERDEHDIWESPAMYGHRQPNDYGDYSGQLHKKRLSLMAVIHRRSTARLPRQEFQKKGDPHPFLDLPTSDFNLLSNSFALSEKGVLGNCFRYASRSTIASGFLPCCKCRFTSCK